MKKLTVVKTHVRMGSPNPEHAHLDIQKTSNVQADKDAMCYSVCNGDSETLYLPINNSLRSYKYTVIHSIRKNGIYLVVRRRFDNRRVPAIIRYKDRNKRGALFQFCCMLPSYFVGQRISRNTVPGWVNINKSEEQWISPKPSD